MSPRRRNRATAPLNEGPLWYKDALIYEVPVRAFRDSNGDGVGDFKGLLEKLDYLQDLGVTALWLLPFYPSPLRDDGYDIASYTDIHRRYGTLDDFKLFLKEAHRRGLRVITELVINHTSDQHPWFQRARHSAPGSPERDFYVWSDTDDRFAEARIIFKDFETSNWTWDPAAGAYYWHRFYSHQPDLNYDNPAVWQAVFEVLDFWLGMGIDGLRLDAIPYLYEREGTNCENLPQTHDFLRALRKHVDDNFQGRMLLAEANQWPEDAVAYLGQGDECHMAFHFPVMPRLFMAIRMEDRLPIIDILAQTPPIPPNCQWAMFLRNHDELTLEMVTDEDRDYMYRVYARDPQARINLGIRRRLAPLLENQRPRIELMNGLLFSLPGTPVLYYGDEIGMGDNIYLGDRNGVRTPMQWTAERNGGFSRANPQSLYLPLIIDPEYHFEAVNVEVQQNNPHSLLWWTKRLIDLRKRHRAFGRGSISFLTPRNSKVLAFVRSYTEAEAGDGQPGDNGSVNGNGPAEPDTDHILVVANLSRFPQFVELDLAAFRGLTPVELMGNTPFPTIDDRPYFLTLGSNAFYWFALEKQRAPAGAAGVPTSLPTFEVADRWENIFQGDPKGLLQEWLPVYLSDCPWFANKGLQIEAAMILETIPVPVASGVVHIALVQVEYTEADAETYVLPVGYATGIEEGRVRGDRPQSILAGLRVLTRDGEAGHAEAGVLYDPLGDQGFSLALLEAILRHQRFKRSAGEVLAVPFLAPQGEARGGIPGGEPGPAPVAVQPAPRAELGTEPDPGFRSAPAPLRNEQRNSSVVYGDRYVLKVFRRIEDGVNPEVETGRFLAEKTPFGSTAPPAGMLEYRRGWGEPMTLAVLHPFVPHQSDGWHYYQDSLGRYFEQALARLSRGGTLPSGRRFLLDLALEEEPALAQEVIGPDLVAAALLGQRTGEMHLALASRPDDPAFAPEPFTTLYQRSLYQSLRSQARQTFALMRKSLDDLSEDVRADARRLESQEEFLVERVRAVYEHKITAQRLRCHGDFNLREVLYTGRDWVVIDFEGMPSRPLSDRRRKYTALRDVAEMLRSFHYAALFALRHGPLRREDQPALAPWADMWRVWVSVAFLKSYLAVAEQGSFLPATREERRILLGFYLIKRALNELRYELVRSPERAAIPIQGLLQVLEMAAVKPGQESADRPGASAT